LAARENKQGAVTPEIWVIEINGTPVVYYSPLDLSAGWEQAPAPYAIGYESADATALGVNVLYQALAR
jgi:hypothetical protein